MLDWLIKFWASREASKAYREGKYKEGDKHKGILESIQDYSLKEKQIPKSTNATAAVKDHGGGVAKVMYKSSEGSE